MFISLFLYLFLYFRQALYDWDPGQDSEECENESLLEAENYKPRGKVAALQALFAMLEYTNRK